MGTLLVFLFLVGLYFIPTILACIRGHRSDLAIGVLNFLLGWTVLGWIIALIWSCTGDTRS